MAAIADRLGGRFRGSPDFTFSHQSSSTFSKRETKRGQSRTSADWRIDGISVGDKALRVALKPRVEYPGAIYHVMNRGNRREPILHDDPDRQRFLETLGEVRRKEGLANPRLVSDGKPFSSGPRNAPSQSGRRDEMVFGHINVAVQPAAQVLWPLKRRWPKPSASCRKNWTGAAGRRRNWRGGAKVIPRRYAWRNGCGRKRR